MNILFLSLSDFTQVKSGLYVDLLSCFQEHGHTVTVVCPLQRRLHQSSHFLKCNGLSVLGVKTLNITGQCNLLEKGVGTLLLERQFTKAIETYLGDDKIDLVLFATPPVTFANVVRFVKRRYGAKAYLLLKDIFPQNAVDLGMFRKNGPLHVFFKHKERQLYRLADFIGCMSPANCTYLLNHEPYLSAHTVEVNPNSRKPMPLPSWDKQAVRSRYGIPTDKTVFIYGGNLGKPQGIDFLIQCIASNEHRSNAVILVIGQGAYRATLEKYFSEAKPANALLLPALPQQEYEQLCASCDCGLIFLDKRFTIPNFPSRALSYMQAAMPYIAAVDAATDIGTIAETNGFGLNCLWGDIKAFDACVDRLAGNFDLIQTMGSRAHAYFLNHYTVEHSYNIIMQHFENTDVQK